MPGTNFHLDNRLSRSSSERSLYNSADEHSDTIDLTGVRRVSRNDRPMTPAENLKAWELNHGL